MRRERSLLFPLISILLLFSPVSYGQLWSGIISPSRAVDWTKAGISGGIPGANWPACTTAQAGTTVPIAPYSGSASTINTALANCANANPSGSYLSLASGTFTLSSGVHWSQSNTVLRGAGANSTFIVASGSGGGYFGTFISIEGSNQGVNGGEGNVCNWTAGYSQGATSITIANCGSTTPAMGSLSNLKVGSILILDQLDEVNDPGTIWNCANSGSYAGGTCAGTIQGGEARTNGTCINSGQMCLRSQQQGVLVASCDGNSTPGHVCTSGTNITISPGLYMPNWRSGQLPQAWFASNVAVHSGVENLSVDTNGGGGPSAFNFGVCNGCWIKGVKSTRAQRSHARFSLSVHSVVRDSYFFENQTGGSVSYGVEILGGWDNLIENNIFQQITDSDPSCTGACEGNVVTYNYDVDNAYASNYYLVPAFALHASGSAFNLSEGNVGPGYAGDAVHGTHHFDSIYRNFLPGWQSVCQGGSCRAQTAPIILQAGSRYFNIIGNVMGEPNYHTTYTCAATTSNSFCAASYEAGGYDKMIYKLNNTGPGYNNIHGFCTSVSCGATSNYDPQTSAYLMRWGNWDTVTGAQWNTSEVPTGIANYSNAEPTTRCTSSIACPASFYYSSKPSWFGSAPWPLIGPEVASGSIGMCSGGTYAGMAAVSNSQCGGGSLTTAWSGHANAPPAMLCYLNTMGGPPDGTGGALTFNADSCYGSDPPPPSPTGLAVVVH